MTEDHEMRLMNGPSLATEDAIINICFGGGEIRSPNLLLQSASVLLRRQTTVLGMFGWGQVDEMFGTCSATLAE